MMADFLSLLKRDFHEILHKFQSLDGGEEDDDQLQTKLQGKDLEEEDLADDAEGRDADVQIENAVKATAIEEKRTEICTPANCDEIAVVEEHCNDEVDEGEELKKRQPTSGGDDHEEDLTERIDQNTGKDNQRESREEIRNMVDKKVAKKEDNEKDDVRKEEEECGAEKKEDCVETIEEEKSREEEEKTQGGGNDNIVTEKQKVYKSGWSSPLGNLAEQMFKNQEEMERAVDQTERLVEKMENKETEKKKEKKVSMQQVVRAFSAVRNLKKIFR